MKYTHLLCKLSSNKGFEIYRNFLTTVLWKYIACTQTYMMSIADILPILNSIQEIFLSM